jgi:hypothetical protein
MSSDATVVASNVGSAGTSQAPNPGQKVCLTNTTQIITDLPDHLLGRAGLRRDGWKGKETAISSARLIETTGDLPSWNLECTIPLSDLEGEAILGAMSSDRSEEMSPKWVGSVLGSGDDY